MTLSQMDWLLLIVQIVLLLGTVFGPLFLRTRWIAYFLYTIAVAVLWLACTICIMWFNSIVKADVPGAGYMCIGFAGWIFGSVIYLVRINKRRELKEAVWADQSGRSGAEGP